ncbi:hypothetical protein MMC11_007029, partial [Xylographa trunciseda]|nr:hypothetical protein [Xylographa trunciseda]
MSAPPPMTPTPGEVDDSTASHILAIVGTLTALALLLSCLRMYVRRVILKSFSTDDWFMLAASICCLGVLICFVGETQNGVGRHTVFLTPANQEEISHWSFYHWVIVTIGISFVKLSIAFLLLRLVTSVWYKRLLWATIAFLIAATLVAAMTLIFSCVPPAANWDPTLLPTAKCFSLSTFTAVGLLNTSVNIVTDVLFVILPIPVIWGLQLNVRTRITLIGVLSLGTFACIASIIKLSIQINILSTPDQTRNDSYNIWNSIELSVGIIAACLPSLRPLFKTMLETTRSYTGSRNRITVYAAGSRHKFRRQDDSGLEYGLGVIQQKEPVVRISTIAGVHSPGGRRTDSEESILHHAQGITKTTDITV